MSKKPQSDPKELDLFYQAIKGTKPIAQKKIRLKPKPRKIPTQAPKSVQEIQYFSEDLSVANVGAEDFISYKHVSISDKIFRKLKKGQYNVEAKLDLHGMNAEMANVAINSFIDDCLLQNVRVALIIHGKGMHSKEPVLKNKLNRWLRQLNVVLAFCSAAPSHGSRGAIYLLLKRNKVEETLSIEIDD